MVGVGLGDREVRGPNDLLLVLDVQIGRVDLVGNLMFSKNTPIQSRDPGTNVDLSPFLPLVATPAKLIDALDLTLTHGTMPAAMKAKLVKAVESDSGTPLHHVQAAAYLILTSGFYNVWH